MHAYTYLLVNFLTVIICFVFSFDKRIQFHLHFRAFLKGSALVAAPFILWDVWFTHTGVWWFNSTYTIGWRIAGLPLEEWLFFICIPFSCVFTYFCLDKFFDLGWANRFSRIIVWLTVVVCLLVAFVFHQKLYPLVTALVTAATVLLLFYVGKAEWIGQASLVFLILMLGFFPVNGVLTGSGLESPIVNYNPEEILNVRMLTIPVEDAVYGYAQFLLNIFFFKVFSGRIKNVHRMKHSHLTYLFLSAMLLLAGCASMPKGAEPVRGFNADEYLGKWYEIARLDHRFERDLVNVTAEYSMRDDGSIRVLNKGFNQKRQEWKSADGKAKFRGEKTVAALKVSFFGPFYSGYNVIALDDSYRYALVAGDNLKYLWILSRETAIPDRIKNDFLEKAERIGYNTAELIWVAHGTAPSH